MDTGFGQSAGASHVAAPIGAKLPGQATGRRRGAQPETRRARR